MAESPPARSRARAFVELHRAVRSAETQPREGIDGDAQPVEPFEVIAPRAWLVTIERGEERIGARSLASIVSTRGRAEGCRRRPWRQQSRVYEQPLALDDHERRRCSQPINSSRSGASRIGASVSRRCSFAWPAATVRR